MPKTVKKPSYLLHKSTGQARVRIGGKDHYLGEYGSPESRNRYDDLIAEWFVRQSVDRACLTVDQLVLKYLDHCDGYYRKSGEATREIVNVRIAVRHLVRLHGRTLARQFGPKMLAAVRESMIAAGLVRRSCNQHVTRIRRMFRWAAAEELIPATTHHALTTVSGLRAGRSKAKESIPVRPVSEAAVSAIEPHVSRQVWAMVQLQLMTGMRPGEVVIMRGCDLNTTGRVWEYAPSSHKTEHHGRRRVIFLGVRAQAIVREFLKSDLSAFLFSPAEARAEFDAERKANRKSRMTPSQAARQKQRNPERSPRDRYDVASYGQAIRKACEVAFGMPAELRNVPTTIPEPRRSKLRSEAKAWREANCWHPHQLRHSAATNIRREFGLDTARTVLGHASAAITEVYAERDFEAARAAAAAIG